MDCGTRSKIPCSLRINWHSSSLLCFLPLHYWLLQHTQYLSRRVYVRRSCFRDTHRFGYLSFKEMFKEWERQALWRGPCNADIAAALACSFSCLVGHSSKMKVKDPCLHRLVFYFSYIKHTLSVVLRFSETVCILQWRNLVSVQEELELSDGYPCPPS